MFPAEPHRKRVKHFDVPGHVHELTFSCWQRLPLLDDDRHKVMLSRAIDAAVGRTGFHVVGFVFMPEHVHLLVYPVGSGSRVASLLYAIKRPHSYRVKIDMENRRDGRRASLIVQERPGKLAFRFWQEGSGYDRNLTRPDAVRAALEYVHANPVRRGLCASPDKWKWSSWHAYHETGPQDPDLPTVHGFPPA